MKSIVTPEELYDADTEQGDIEGVDVKINPQFYMHMILNKLSDCLLSDNITEGMSKYRMMVELLQTYAEAAGYLPDEYRKTVLNYMDTDEYKNQEKDYIASMKLANKKLDLILREVFSYKTITAEMKI